jgi:hypothetical protein
MRMRGFAAAALAASLLLVPAAGPVARAESSGMVPRGQVAWASLDHAVAVLPVGGTAGTGQVSVAEGAVGFPVAVSTTGATGEAGSVPDAACLSLEVRGHEVATGQADAHGRFAVVGQVPAGAVATIQWHPCAGSTDQRDCHNAAAHAGNPNKDEAASHVGDQGCAAAGDAGPDS